MKKILSIVLLVLAFSVARAQSPSTPTAGPGNTAGVLYASNFGLWSVPQGNAGQFSWSSPSFCTATAASIPLNPVFAVGTPVTIKDIIPANTEIVIPTAVNVAGAGCSITVNPTNPHNTFTLESATAGLQEGINYAHALPYVVVLTPDWSRLGGTTGMITSASGSTGVSILDERNSCLIAYNWSGSAYVQTANFCTGGGGGGSCPDSVAGAGWAQFSDGSACVGEFIDSEITYGNSLTIQPSPGDQLVLDPTIGFTREATTTIYGKDEDNAIDLYADGEINADAQSIAFCGYNGVQTGPAIGHCPNGQITTQTVYGELNVTDGEFWTDGGIEDFGGTGGGFLQYFPDELNFSGSPYTLGYSAYFEPVDASDGDVVINLDEICAIENNFCNNGISYLFTKEDSSGNTVTIVPFGSQTIQGASSTVLTTKYQTVDLVADYTGNVGGTPTWIIKNASGGGGGGTAWGSITGTLSAQTDLQTALNGKQAAGTYVTPTTLGNDTLTASLINLSASGTVTFPGLAGAGTDCVQIDSSGHLSNTGAACGSGSGAVNSVTNSDGTLTISPTTGSVIASLALGHANTWTGNQTSAKWIASTGFDITGANTAGHYTRNNGTDYVDSAIQVADVPTLNQPTTSHAAALGGGAVGSAPYQSAANTTLFIPSPTTNGHYFVYSWQPTGSAIDPVALDLATWYATLTVNATQVNGAALPASALFGGWNSSHQAVASTAGNMATLLAGLTNCTISGYPYVPGDNQCDAPGAGLPPVQLTMPTSTINAGTCTSAQNVTVTGLVAPSGSTPGSTFSVAYEGNPSAVTGWGTSGGLSLKAWVSTANTLSWNVCNATASNITPGALKVDVGSH